MTIQAQSMPQFDMQKSRAIYIVPMFVATWFVIVMALAVSGVFDVPASEPALPTLIAIAVPVTLFAGATLLSARVRHFVLSLDPILLTELQSWRILGGVFLAVYAFGHLPGLFAWPAGLGDVAIGVAAPFIVWKLRRDPDFLKASGFRRFHYLGLLDFVVAVAMGIASRNTIPGLVDGVTSSAMGQIPLVLIPTFVVPSFIILHLIALSQSFAGVREGR